MAKAPATDPDRMTAGGLYNYAVSYHRSADHLVEAKVKVTHREMPIRALYHHCIELYLKAFLRSKGLTPGQLKKIGHDMLALETEVQSYGFPLGGEELWVLSRLRQGGAMSLARYIETGTHFLAPLESLTRTAEGMRKTTRAHLKAAGEPVR